MTVDWQFITAIRLPLFSTNRFTLGFQSIWYSIIKVIDLVPLGRKRKIPLLCAGRQTQFELDVYSFPHLSKSYCSVIVPIPI
jgi:hypothetical protein